MKRNIFHRLRNARVGITIAPRWPLAHSLGSSSGRPVASSAELLHTIHGMIERPPSPDFPRPPDPIDKPPPDIKPVPPPDIPPPRPPDIPVLSGFAPSIFGR
jgi:hypothetical protein